MTDEKHGRNRDADREPLNTDRALSLPPPEEAWGLLDACRYTDPTNEAHDRGTPVVVGFEATRDLIARLLRERGEAREQLEKWDALLERIRAVAGGGSYESTLTAVERLAQRARQLSDDAGHKKDGQP